MIEIHSIPDTNILEFSINGKIGQSELDAALDAFGHAVDEQGTVNVLKEIRSFQGYDNVDLKGYLQRAWPLRKYVGRTAVVTDLEWAGWIATVFGPFMDAQVKTFGLGEREAAIAWLSETPAEDEDVPQPAVEMSENPNGVIELAINGHITREDVKDAIENLREAHDRLGPLRLLEIDRQFDGMDLSALWEDLKFVPANLSMFSHVAVVSDRNWLQSLARMSDHVVSAEIRPFSIDELDRARHWLASPESGLHGINAD